MVNSKREYSFRIQNNEAKKVLTASPRFKVRSKRSRHCTKPQLPQSNSNKPTNTETPPKRYQSLETSTVKSSTYFSANGSLFFELFFCFPERFVETSGTVFPFFQKLLLIFLKLWDLSHDSIENKESSVMNMIEH